FSFALISDHFHPWTDKQGQSPFVWSVIGAIAATTKKLQLGTGVTCPTEKQARRIAHVWWPTSAFAWPLLSELAIPEYFEEAAKSVTEDAVAEAVLCSPDPEEHINKIRETVKMGADHVYVHQVGKDQEGFFRFYEREVLPEFRTVRRAA